MEKDHDWIADEKDNFARPNTPYDFLGQNIAECKSSLRNLTERFQGMKKKINPKVMATIDAVEKKEAALKGMMKTVVRDKRKIEETIGTLDEYKKEALEKTWVKVDRDFGAIFAELLPGSFAKLVPLEGKGVGDGLEVKVSLGKVWKTSLAELSGGQRYGFYAFYLSLFLRLCFHSPLAVYSLLPPTNSSPSSHLPFPPPSKLILSSADPSSPSPSSSPCCNTPPRPCTSSTKSTPPSTSHTRRTSAA